MVRPSSVGRACENFNMLLEVCFGRNLELVKKVRVMVSEVVELEALSVDFIVRWIDKMLAVLFLQMRETTFDEGGHPINLSVETAWKGVCWEFGTRVLSIERA